jgi:Tol biopolymer transport system component
MGNREMRMPGRHGWSEVRRPLAALGTVCLLMAGCTDTSGDHRVAAAPTPADAPTPTSIPRNPGALAYGVNGDIFVADPDGSNAVRIANGRPPNECHGLGEYWGEGPIWSPDGRYLAYRHTDCDGPRNAWWDVVISDRKGNVVTSFPGEGWLISWSPDSTRVAGWVRWGETIGIYGLSGVRETLLTVPPGWMAPGDFDPTWSPDGESLLVPHGVLIPLDGSAPRKLPWADRPLGWEKYSPDGSRLAYGADRSVVVAEADGSNPQEVFGDWPGNIAWSPTGDQIAFTSAKATQLRVLDVATGTVTLLAETDGSGVFSVMAGGAGFEFSPQGDRILFSRTDRGGRPVSSLWSVNADGSHLRRLVAGTPWGDWSSPSQIR